MNKIFFKEVDRSSLLKNHQIIVDVFKKIFDPSTLRKDSMVGLKIHFGEKGNKSYIHPRMLLSLVRYLKECKLKVFLFDTNTLYRGKRTNAIDHIMLAYQHGFGKLNVPIIIGDGIKGNDYIQVDIKKKHFKTCYIASIVRDLDFMIVLSHFTGHMLTGFGASIKNIGMGCASRRGKLAQHCDCSPKILTDVCVKCGTCKIHCPAQCIKEKDGYFYIDNQECIGCAQCIAVCPNGAVKIVWSNEYDIIQEKMVEYAYAVVKQVKCIYLNFCVFITKDCDCMNKEEQGRIDDLGILAGDDPVAIDKASIDLINQREGKEILKEWYPQINYKRQLEYGSNIGLGNQNYTLVKV